MCKFPRGQPWKGGGRQVPLGCESFREGDQTVWYHSPRPVKRLGHPSLEGDVDVKELD